MKTEVVWHRYGFSRLAAWIGARTRFHEDARDYLRDYTRIIHDALVLHRGQPPGSIKLEMVSPPAMAWEFIEGRLWIVYVIKYRGGWLRRLFGLHTAPIIVWNVYEQFPDAEVLLLPPS